MIPIEFGELLGVVSGAVVGRSELEAPERVCRVVTDSRRVEPGDLFIALPGTRHHGGEFLSDAAQRGAAVAIVGPAGGRCPDMLCVRVEDAFRALWKLASWNRDRCPATRIAVTGSFAKTTTRQMIHQILSTVDRAYQSPENFNNHVGVPLSLLGLSHEESQGVFEVAASGRGEIGPLSELVQPAAAVLTGLGRAHLGGFGSFESVVNEKLELLTSVRPGGLVVVPEECRGRLDGSADESQLVSVGVESAGDVVATKVKHRTGELEFEVDGREFRLSVAGRHFVSAALSAVAVARWCGIDDRVSSEALSGFRTAAGRCRVEKTALGTVIDDSYNASPESMLAACRLLSEWRGKGRRVLVLGDMAELGDQAANCHGEVGAAVASSGGIDRLWAAGWWAESTVAAAIEAGMPRKATWSADSVEQLLESLPELLQEGDTVLVKGARRARMERVVEQFCRVEC
ncbi:MAG: UDP-N-acetylmuramoyl-tripeptide--D-alanyl-D-alanine ligase [Planctomycetota bacterium]|nr:UDP-N-acetylmuramoyl-tripeptide--D-alanyl-D-alanine ligase [Planctomycetota bacterium]